MTVQQEIRRWLVNENEDMKASERLTFPFPFVHHQPRDWKVEQLLTMEINNRY